LVRWPVHKKLQKQDVRREGERWIVTITPDAGTVRSNKLREIRASPASAPGGDERTVRYGVNRVGFPISALPCSITSSTRASSMGGTSRLGAPFSDWSPLPILGF
jgi:hypothetical protein